MKNRIVSLVSIFSFLVVINILFTNASSNVPGVFGATGLKELTPEESHKLHKIKIKKVNPNKLSIERINKERVKRGLNPTDVLPSAQEVITDDSSAIDVSGASTSSSVSGAISAIPAQVDNSALAAFPKIGNQGSSPSCVAWASTYYLQSHEVCLTLGCDNKTSSTLVFSPKWTYNMINGGAYAGTYFSDAISMIQSHGAATLAQLPYTPSDYLSWDLNPNDWKSAINYKMNLFSSVTINSDTAMANAKQLLANGHVLMIGTYITSWQFRQVMTNPNSVTNPFVGQAIATYLNGRVGAHAMTVVGYDDSIWVDINGDGSVQSAELGAFKIANSWGSSWGNGGFVWASYDAFRSTTTVPNWSPTSRVQLTQSGYAYTSTYSPYTPKLLALVTVSHATRNQMSFNFGSSSTSSQTPQVSWSSFAFRNKGGGYAFDGSSTAIEGSFYFDISNLYTSTSVDNLIFYLTSTDNASGNALSVSSFQIVDPSIGNTLATAANVPQIIDASSGTLAIGSYTVDITDPTAPTNLSGTLTTTTSKKGKRIITTTSVKLNWSSSSDNVGVVSYNIYRNNVKIASSASLSYTDGSTSGGITYTYQVTAVDAAGNESLLSNSVIIAR